MKVTWNKKDATYYDRGRKAYGFGDEIPKKVLEAMGEETAEEYMAKGFLKPGLVETEEKNEKVVLETVQGTTEHETVETDEGTTIKLEFTIDDLKEKAVSLGLKPHHNAGIEKIQEMIDEAEEQNKE